jgi:hypothetical protein
MAVTSKNANPAQLSVSITKVNQYVDDNRNLRVTITLQYFEDGLALGPTSDQDMLVSDISTVQLANTFLSNYALSIRQQVKPIPLADLSFLTNLNVNTNLNPDGTVASVDNNPMVVANQGV